MRIGSRLVVQYTAKKSKGPQSESGHRIAGVPGNRPAAYRRLSARKRTITRAYGGSKTHAEVRNKIVRAFLVEEVKQLKQQSAQAQPKEQKPKAKAPQ